MKRISLVVLFFVLAMLSGCQSDNVIKTVEINGDYIVVEEAELPAVDLGELEKQIGDYYLFIPYDNSRVFRMNGERYDVLELNQLLDLNTDQLDLLGIDYTYTHKFYVEYGEHAAIHISEGGPHLDYKEVARITTYDGIEIIYEEFVPMPFHVREDIDIPFLIFTETPVAYNSDNMVTRLDVIQEEFYVDYIVGKKITVDGHDYYDTEIFFIPELTPERMMLLGFLNDYKQIELVGVVEYD